MRLRSLSVAVIAAAIVLPGPATAGADNLPTSMFVTSLGLMLPFAVVYRSGTASAAASKEASVDADQRWNIARMREDGGKTAMTLHSEDQQLQIDVAIDTQVARREGLQVGDAIDIDPVGKAGYVMRKDKATIALLGEPGSAMTHSKARN